MFEDVSAVEDLWEGDMQAFELGGQAVVVVHNPGGEIVAFEGLCPHQQAPLSEGLYEDGRIICTSHMWEFDGRTGRGVNPSTCHLRQIPLRIRDGRIEVDVTRELEA